MSEYPAAPETVWPYVESGCSLSEIAAWFGITEDAAGWYVMMTRRRKLIPAACYHMRED